MGLLCVLQALTLCTSTYCGAADLTAVNKCYSPAPCIFLTLVCVHLMFVSILLLHIYIHKRKYPVTGNVLCMYKNDIVLSELAFLP